ncbi:MAG: hypothetical protein GWN79_14330, partial [Actinobacteria bacterium]|nr:hypothetical protein [Actinomycetota bacterium]NIS32833.1 hypothetical protein [Actinomycetota bacterium]NIT96488.1 hypothetical protein [Actinomycetota bacterium]NIU20185.1 hypothetical protein [Actinomycetota bacterium]NIU67807.1 hypothetical protein [Actinomycetota bacterium]
PVLGTLNVNDLLEILGPALGSLIIGDLLDIIGAENLLLGDLLGLIDPAVLDGFSLADLLLAFLAPSEVPFESIDLDGALLQNVADPPQPEFRY